MSKLVAKYPHSLYIINCFHGVINKIEVTNESRRRL